MKSEMKWGRIREGGRKRQRSNGNGNDNSQLNRIWMVGCLIWWLMGDGRRAEELRLRIEIPHRPMRESASQPCPARVLIGGMGAAIPS